MLKKSLIVLTVAAKAAVLALAVGAAFVGTDDNGPALCCFPNGCWEDDCEES